MRRLTEARGGGASVSIGAANPDSQDVEVTVITTGFQLGSATADLDVGISDAETASLDRDDFTESGTGPWTYVGTYVGASDGTYVVTLNTAQDSGGTDYANGETDSVVVDTSGQVAGEYNIEYAYAN